MGPDLEKLRADSLQRFVEQLVERVYTTIPNPDPIAKLILDQYRTAIQPHHT